MFLLDLLDLYQAVLKEALRAFSILKNEREATAILSNKSSEARCANVNNEDLTP